MANRSDTQASSPFDNARNSTALAGAIGFVFSVSLAVTLFAAGFFACTLQPTTALFSRLYSNFEESAFLPDETVSLAVSTRDFTVEPYGSGETAAADRLAREVLKAAHASSAQGSPKSARWEGVSIPPLPPESQESEHQATSQGSSKEDTLSLDLRKERPVSGQSEAQELPEALAGMYALSTHGSAYGLGPDEISHLVDCNRLVTSVSPILVVLAVVALVSGVALGVAFGRRTVGSSLVAAPAVLLVAMVGIGLWAAIDFQGFFAAFHSLLFPQGNWTFPYDSLLICMLPTMFWVGMAGLWVVVTVGLSISSVVVGRNLRRR